MKFIVTEIGKGNYGLGGTLLTRENLFSIGGGTNTGDGGGVNEIPRIINFNSGYDTGFTYNVYAEWWFGNTYELTKTITLSNSDEFLDRIDVIAVDNTGDIVVIEGIPAFNPVKPEVNPLTQLEGTFIYIPALSNSPEGITTTVVYDEQLEGEWIASVPSGGTSVVLDSTNNPFTGSTHIEGTNVSLNKSIQFNNPTTDLEVIDVNYFAYRIQNKTSIASLQGDTHKILLTGTTSSGATTFEYLPLPNTVGYDSENTTTYQFVSLPIPKTTPLVRISRVTIVCNVPTDSLWGFHIDNIRFVGGIQENVTFNETDPTVPAYTKTLDSANKLLTELLTVDGSGSGLDADFLDGKDWTYFDHTIPGYITGITSNDGSVTIDNSTPGIYDLSVPTKVSQLENDLGFITLADVVAAEDEHFIDNFGWNTGQSQIFTLTHTPEQILVASINGVIIEEEQFSVDFVNGTIEVLDPLNDGDSLRVLYSYDALNIIPAFHTNEFNYVLGNPQNFTLTYAPNYILSITVQGQMLAFAQYTVDATNKLVTINNDLTDDDLVRVSYQYIPVEQGGTPPPPNTPTEPQFYGEEYVWTSPSPQTFALTNVPAYVVNIAVQGQVLSMNQYTLDTQNNEFTILNELDENDLVKIIYQY